MAEFRGRGGRGRGRGGSGPPSRGDTPSSHGNSPSPYEGGRGGRGFGGGQRGGGRGRGGGPQEPQGPLIYLSNEPVVLPPRLKDNSQQQLIQAFKQAGYRVEQPLRPGYGTLGRQINLRANFFAVKLPKGPYYDYAVVIKDSSPVQEGGKKGKGKPKQPGGGEIKSDVKRRIFQLLENDPNFQPFKPHVAHDFSQRIVSAKQLPQPLDISITFIEEFESKPTERAKVYSVSVQYLWDIDLNAIIQYTEGNLQYRDYESTPVLSALNLVLQHHASHTGVRVGKKDNNGASKFFFDPGQGGRRLAPGSDLWQGFFISVRPAFKQLMVNVNVCYTAFVEPGNLGEALDNIGRKTHGAMPTLPHGLVDSIKVKTRHLGYKKKLHQIGTTTARNTFFQCSEYNERVSVEMYFKRKYGIQLKRAHDLPVVSLGTIVKKETGKREHVWVPAELCDIVSGLPRRGKLSDDETKSMINYACNPPGTNARDIVEKGLPRLGFSAQNRSPILDQFEIQIENKMVSIQARVLPPPSLSYREGRADMREGSWNILNVKFHRGAHIKSWWVLYVKDVADQAMRQNMKEEIKALAEAFREKCKKCGMTIPQGLPDLLPPAGIYGIDDDSARTNALRNIQRLIEDRVKHNKGKPSFILVLLEKTDKYIYPGIKRIGDVILGIHTVHMLLNKALVDNRKVDVNKQDQYLSNIALKVNTKLGGTNHKLDDNAMRWLRKKPTMMVGIDVTHAGPGSRLGTPSIAAVVASVDDSFVQFPCSLRVQQHARNKETLDELCDMLVERLQVYQKHNKRLPARVFIFRDGVSEGQFPVVLKEELPQVLKAFVKLSAKGEYRPLLSIVVCGKRHHAKPFATASQDADKNGNTKPGTVVDRGITSVFDFDFYLQAHAGIKGTAKSTHYTVIYDENRFEADEIQKGTNDTSYLYARATRSVSLIPPAYYADLACERGRCYLNEFLNADDRTTAVSMKSGKSDLEAEKQRVFEAAVAHWGDGLHNDMRETMFYI